MDIEVLYFEGSPSFMKLLPRLRELVVEGGGDPDDIVLRNVETPEASESAQVPRFVDGSHRWSGRRPGLRT